MVKTVEIEKVCLSPFDAKRYILKDCITTLVYGHYKLLHEHYVYDTVYD